MTTPNLPLLGACHLSPPQVASFNGEDEDDQEEAEEDIASGHGQQHMYYPPGAAASLAPPHANDHLQHHQHAYQQQQHLQHQHLQHVMGNGGYIQNDADYAPYNGDMNQAMSNGAGMGYDEHLSRVGACPGEAPRHGHSLR